MAKGEQATFRQKYSMFRYSTPGYYFEEVEETINEYKKTISDLGELLLKKDSIIKDLEDQRDKLESFATELQLQLNSMTVPEMSEEESIEILDGFTESLYGTTDLNMDGTPKETSTQPRRQPQQTRSKQNPNRAITGGSNRNNPNSRNTPNGGRKTRIIIG